MKVVSEFRDNIINENSLQNLSKISLLTPSLRENLNSMKKIFPVETNQKHRRDDDQFLMNYH